MSNKIDELIRIKEEIVKQVEDINKNIKREDIEDASISEKAEYMELMLEIQGKLMKLEAINEVIKDKEI